jgi:6-pyruvoyl-tetrahydropterin synthase
MALLFVDHLTVIDCAYLDLQRGLVGESWIVDLELEGDLDAQSMVLDFGEVKRRIKRAIDHGPDHTLLVPSTATGVRLGPSGPDRSRLDADTELGLITLDVPAVSITSLATESITSEAVARHCEALVRDFVPASVSRIHLSLRLESIDGAYYQYVHGLKKHDGACQRIAHGHRSRLEITINGARNAALEQQLSETLRDTYFVSAEDITEITPTHLHTAYNAPEGRFELRLPHSAVTQIDSDSTVECLAEWLLTQAEHAHPGASIRVRAFEGVQKGAIATSEASIQ